MGYHIDIRHDFDVTLVEHGGSDDMICRAARVSTGRDLIDSKESAGLIRFLMSNRHGSPFEHSFMVFRINAPIFVWREFMRHRIGISYNEQSGRYMELAPVFYIPPVNRELIQMGKPGEYIFVFGDSEQYYIMQSSLHESYKLAWQSYQNQLHAGIAKEVARMCLPVAVYSAAYVTMNPRSMMHFLSLRTRHDNAKFPSKPMWEINEVANQMEAHFAELFPKTHDAFVHAGRVAP